MFSSGRLPADDDDDDGFGEKKMFICKYGSNLQNLFYFCVKF